MTTKNLFSEFLIQIGQTTEGLLYLGVRSSLHVLSESLQEEGELGPDCPHHQRL